jgi:ribonuclease BN (tRNA processing enzyme)
MAAPGGPGRSRNAISRRAALLGGVATAALSPFGAGAQATPAAGDYRTTLRLIGTGGGPIPTGGKRVGICSAIVVEDRAYIIDLGQSCLNNIVRSGIKLPWIQAVFITHLHSDHIAELYNLVWLNLDPTYGITHPIDVWGPGRAGGLPAAPSATPVSTVDPVHPTPGLSDYFALSIAATAYDANLRIRDEGWHDVQDMVRTHEIALPDVGASATGDIAPPMDPFPVMENDDVKVTGILVRHTPVFPSFAFRFDTADGSVAFSGDTTVDPNFVTLAKGAEIVVHEVIDLDWVASLSSSPTQLDHLRQSHTDVDEVGAIAEATGARTLVLTHLVPDGDEVSDETWRSKAQQGFSGEVIVGTDLAVIGVGAPRAG